MTGAALVWRSLVHYWRTNLAVAAGVAAAVAALAGALLVGHSVRESLRDLVLGRLGRTEAVILSNGYFREKLADAFPGACPLIALRGIVAHQESGRRAGGVLVYGVDERYWKFQGAGEALNQRQVRLSAALARELGAKPADGILVRMETPSAIPAESLHGQRDKLGRTIRLSMAGEAAEFSLRPQQGAVRAAFVPLRRLQREIGQEGKVNTILLASGEGAEGTLRERFELEDLGVRLRPLAERGVVAVESDSLILSDGLAEKARAAAAKLGLRTQGIFTYLANTIRVGPREIPYSLVAAVEEEKSGAEAGGAGAPATMVLNEWAARDLGAKTGDAVTIEYYLWGRDGRLATGRAEFELTGVVPIAGAAADRDLAPQYPGITDSETLDDWDPPFPLDLRRVRPKDEEYWKKYRTTPKAFLLLAKGQELWGSRFGRLTSLRVVGADPEAYRKTLRETLDPLASGLTVAAVRREGLQASQGATDFGEYFVYFSFFLVAAALLLAGLFFRLGVEQRLREIGLLRALGFGPARVRKLFLAEGLALAAAGSAAGVAGAWGYSSLIVHGLRTWWSGAAGTDRLAVHLAPGPLAAGGLGGVAAALICIAWTLRGLRGASPRNLLSGQVVEAAVRERRWPGRAGAACAAAALLLLGAAAAGRVPAAGGFFGAGSLLLAAAMCYEWVRLAGRRGRPVGSVIRLGFRNAAHRPGRSVLSISLVASAIFLLVAVDAFRRPERPAWQDPKSGAGGYPLVAESVVPVVNLAEIEGVKFVPFRLRPGDDTSCLNLYQPQEPRVLGAPERFLREGRFTFQASLGKPENPWLLLEDEPAGGAIPAIGDANSITYVLHKKLGDEVMVGGKRLRLVAALSHSLFQGELIVAEKHFLRAFPEEPGYRFFLLESADAGRLEEALADYGFDAGSSADRLASFDRVENTYLSTFQALGGLGLLVGTAGLAAVLLRNVLERRRELALLQAVGYRRRDLARMVLAENVWLLGSGVAAGTVCALLAIVPAFLSRGGRLSVPSLALLLAGVTAAGLAASLAAVRAAVRGEVAAVLRGE